MNQEDIDSENRESCLIGLPEYDLSRVNTNNAENVKKCTQIQCTDK